MPTQNFNTSYATTRKGNISVDQALKKARLQLVFLPLGILLACVFLPIIPVTMMVAPDWIIAIAIPAGIIGLFLTAAILSPKWKVWAFENVRNVHELKHRALLNNLMLNDRSFFNRFEIWNAQDRRKWKHLQEKFKNTDEFHDDPDVPKETRIFFSRVSAYILIPFCCGMAFMGTSEILYGSDKPARGYIFIAFAVVFMVIELRKLLITKPRIVISNRGIETAKVPFYPWNEIRHEDVIRRGAGKHTKYILTYRHPGGTAEIHLNEYGIKHDRMYRLLGIYRSRFNKENNIAQ